jgi:N6-adenosine-specific RNA methylase IME4
MSKKYQIIYADPPWDYKGQTQHTGKGGQSSGGSVKHYGTLKLAQLKMLDIDSIADKDCLLFMWSTNPHLDQAIELMKSWGFQWATVGFVWNKDRVNPGFYTMSQCELCLIGKRGKIPRPRGARNIRQLVISLREAHSRKPDEVRKRIEEMFPYQNKVELFAREALPGWDVWGDEIPSTVNITWK